MPEHSRRLRPYSEPPGQTIWFRFFNKSPGPKAQRCQKILDSCVLTASHRDKQDCCVFDKSPAPDGNNKRNFSFLPLRAAPSIGGKSPRNRSNDCTQWPHFKARIFVWPKSFTETINATRSKIIMASGSQFMGIEVRA